MTCLRSELDGQLHTLIGGVLADRYGFNAVNWMGAVGAVLSVVVIVIGIWPRAKDAPGSKAEGKSVTSRPRTERLDTREV